MWSLPSRLAAIAIAAVSLACVSGCIADTPEDSDLPWSQNKGWEGMIPLPANALHQYD